MADWAYRCYDDGKPGNLWQRWYDLATDAIKGSHDSKFEILEQLETWGPPHTDLLIKSEKIYEVRLTGKVKYRVLGYYSGQQVYTVLGICSHKGKVYTPKKIKDTVTRIKKAIEAGQAGTITCDRPQ